MPCGFKGSKAHIELPPSRGFSGNVNFMHPRKLPLPFSAALKEFA